MSGKSPLAALGRGALLGASIVALQAFAPAASATDGYFQYGYGARQKALGGAGVADSRDATAAALNPAGLVHAPTELTVSGTLFSPLRSYSVSGPGPTPEGTFDSKGNYFPVPNLAFTYRDHGLPFVDVIGVTVYGNGGMNTAYPANLFSAFGSSGRLGVDFEQAFLSVAFAKTLAPGLSIGVAPILARQAIKLEGLQGFAAFSSDGAHVSNQGTDVSWGGGVRGGIEWALAPQFRIGVAGNSRIYTNEFEKYRGLFAERGGFDVPASVQAGIAFDATPNLTFLADYKHIWYGSVASIANPSTNILSGAALGTDNGPGFGWKDIDIIKVGAEWRHLGNLTLRAGYSYNTSPLQSRDVLFNVLAPATVQHHITGGFEYAWSRNLAFEVAGAYVPETSISGSHLFTPQTIDLSMHQWEATVGLKYRFDQEPAPLK